ncbi:MAG: bis(5'-nucleosyl)-tetraphosphatase (symmetrical) YqeK [Lachnospiraceae bacterium]|nr:bis(5'-nucleosyl)-tetraphosphatase (symmetrical) YqeK [Candidatus Colinaster equi]
MTKKEIIRELKEKLDIKRFEHTLGVAYTASSLAMKYEYDLNKAFLAGLLHDCAKGMSDKEKLQYCKKYKIAVTDVEQKNPSLLHAKVGAHLSKNKYEIDDPAICSSIMYHTTGKPNMDILEQIIFIADYIEPLRDHDPELAQIRKEAFENLDHATYHIYRNTMSYLSSSTKELDPMTQKAYLYYSENM